MNIFSKLIDNLSKGIIIDLDATFSKPFFKKSALGRTISGRNKTGQIIQTIGQTALSFTPFGDKLTRVMGRTTSDEEIKEIAKHKGKSVATMPRMNLKNWEAWAVKIGFALLVAGLYWAVQSGYIPQEVVNAFLQALNS